MNEPVVIARAQDLGDVVLKFMGLCFLFYGVFAVPLRLTFSFRFESSDLRKLGEEMSGVILLIVGVCLIRWSAILSKKLFGPLATAGIPLPISAELQAVAFRTIGVYMFVNCLPQIVQLLFEMADEDNFWMGTAAILPTLGTYLVLSIVLLFFRSSWISPFWKHSRFVPSSGNSSGATGDAP